MSLQAFHQGCSNQTRTTNLFIEPTTGPEPLFRFGPRTLVTSMLNLLHHNLSTYQYVATPLLSLLLGCAIEDPSIFPTAEEVVNRLVCFMYAGVFVFCVCALETYIETETWFWEEDGWVWPWQRFLWRMVYEDEEEDATVVVERRSGEEETTAHDSSIVHSELDSPPTLRLLRGSQASNISRAPTPVHAHKSSCDDPLLISPLTSSPPRRSQASNVPVPLAPVHAHHSGLLGESPVPFNHFSGRGFANQQRRRAAVTEWMNAGTSKQRKREALDVLMRQDHNAEEPSDDEPTCLRIMASG